MKPPAGYRKNSSLMTSKPAIWGVGGREAGSCAWGYSG